MTLRQSFMACCVLVTMAGLVLVATAFARPGTINDVVRAGEGLENPAAQRLEMIKLLRSIDARLGQLQSSLELIEKKLPPPPEPKGQ